MRYFFGLVLLAGIAAGGFVAWLQFEASPPRVESVGESGALPRDAALAFRIHADPPGLRRVEVRVQPEGADTGTTVHEQHFPATSWRGSGVLDADVSIQPDFTKLGVAEGKAVVQVYVDTYAWHLRPQGDGPRFAAPLEIDRTPPRLDLLSSQHNIRLGGVEAIVFRQSPDTVESGVQVGDYFFPATRGVFAEPEVAIVLFAVPQDLTTEARPLLWARDGAGNRREMRIACPVKEQTFRERTLEISDSFLERIVPGLEEVNNLPRSGKPLDGYLTINRDVRRQNEERIRAACQTTRPTIDWDGAFQRQAAATLSSFGDRRSYAYGGEVVDRQTHLGVDLASLKMMPVSAAQNGTVVFAENLGIYGLTVILDHGLGIFTLYGHLSSIDVQVGETIERGATLGKSGETGLAGGDHLHFSVMVHGIHVDPVEWWDPRWVRNRILARLDLAPRAPAAAQPEAK